MATAAQIIANRQNASLSTGPRTDAGKARSSVNAFQHGLTSSKVVLPHESQEEFDRYRADALEHLGLANDHERSLAERVVATYWRMQRMYRVETAFLKQRMQAVAEANPDLTPGDEALAMMFIDPAEMKRVALMQRYIASAERAHNRAVADLDKAQKERRRREAEEAWLEEATRPEVEEPEQAAAASAGFVSHTGPTPPSQSDSGYRTRTSFGCSEV